MTSFNKNLFDLAFQQALESLANAERITKDTLRDLSRSVLEAHHETQDIGYINRLINVLTPMNRKAAILYFKAFSGFNWDDGEAQFMKKDKKHYDKAHKAAVEFLAEPHNNIWTWADRNIDMDVKKLDLAKITQYFKGVLTKAGNEGIPQAEVLKAVFAAGVEGDTIVALMQQMIPNEEV